jgi:hypothetical protein
MGLLMTGADPSHRVLRRIVAPLGTVVGPESKLSGIHIFHVAAIKAKPLKTQQEKNNF